MSIHAAGTLVTPEATPPAVHICIGSRQAGVALPAAVPAFAVSYDPAMQWHPQARQRCREARQRHTGATSA